MKSQPADWLAARASASPDKDFLIIGSERLTFGEAHRRAQALCGSLRIHANIQSGDRVALLMPAGQPYVISLLALMRAGALAVPLNTRLTSTELQWQLKNTACRLGIGCIWKIRRGSMKRSCRFCAINFNSIE